MNEKPNVIDDPWKGGPYVQVAAFCEQVLQERDGVHSLIRIIDTVTQHSMGPDAPEQMPPITSNLKLVLMLKPGRALGRHQIKITPFLPSGESRQPALFDINLEGNEKGATIVLDFINRNR